MTRTVTFRDICEDHFYDYILVDDGSHAEAVKLGGEWLAVGDYLLDYQVKYYDDTRADYYDVCVML